MGAGARDRDRPPAERMLACLSKPGLTGREARVLAVLAYHDGRGGCWPSDDTIARGAGVGPRSSVAKARQGLRRKGWLRWTHGQHVNRYEIAYGAPFEFDVHCPGDVTVEGGPLSGKRHSGDGASSGAGRADAQLGLALHADAVDNLENSSAQRGGGDAPLSGKRHLSLSGKRYTNRDLTGKSKSTAETPPASSGQVAARFAHGRA